MLHRHAIVNQTLCVKRSDTPIFLTDIRDFFNAWYPSACVPTRKKGMNVSLHLAQQNSVQCIANLSHFLCITFSKRRRKPNGRRYFPNNRQHLAGVYFSFRPRDNTRAHTRWKRVAANLITFDRRRRKLSSPLRRFNVPETRRCACEKRETTRTMYSAQYVAMNYLAPKCDATVVPYGWKETGYTDVKVFLTKSSRGMRRSRSFVRCSPLSALHLLTARERIMISAK